MNLLYATTYDASDIRNWSGTGLHIAQSLRTQGVHVEFAGPMDEQHRLPLKVKQLAYCLFGKRYFRERSPLVLKGYAKQIFPKLRSSSIDVVFSPGTLPIAYLDCKQPIAFWTDATFAGMIDFYPDFTNLAGAAVREGNAAEKSALDRCKLAIYSSEWAAKSAIEFYGADPCKVRVVSFGANLESEQTLPQIQQTIASKKQKPCRLLFMGVDWIRKGGPMALAVARALNERGVSTELKIVGCTPPPEESLPSYVTTLGFISKSSDEGRAKLGSLLREAHFLIVPSIAECTPIVFCEANAAGVPCLTTDVGGIPSVIRNDINGRTFTLGATPDEYCDYISSLMERHVDYERLALSSFNEYRTRLNWKTAGTTIAKLLSEIV